MISIVYSATTARDVQCKLGEAEYSYYFVLKEFSEVFKSFGPVIVVTDPAREVDPIFREAKARGEECIFFSFAPPQATALGLECPTVPVFAWEFDTIPNETWFGERQQDWRYTLDRAGRAITHSSATVRTVKDAMGSDFPVMSMLTPLWDRFAAKSEQQSHMPISAVTQIEVTGIVIDSRTLDLSRYAPRHSDADEVISEPLLDAGPKQTSTITLNGVIYFSVFNPLDGRKNWPDIIAGFCHGLRDAEDATLVLKLAHHQGEEHLREILEWLYKLAPFRCRILMLMGFLATEQYDALVRATSYVVNASLGEGQCLPLMEGMASGKPAIAPRHSALADYIDTPQAFVVQSSAAPGMWPHDTRAAYRTLRQRIDLNSLVKAYRQSYAVAKNDPARYAQMSAQAREVMRQNASRAVVTERLQTFLKMRARAAGPEDQYGRVAKPALYGVGR